jgi:hypothetical protein
VPPPIHRPPAANVNANLVTHVLNPAPGGPVDAALPLHPPCLRRLMTNPPSTIACTFSSPPGSRGIADMTTASREKPSSQSAHAYNPSAPSCYHPWPSQAFPSRQRLAAFVQQGLYNHHPFSPDSPSAWLLQNMPYHEQSRAHQWTYAKDGCDV